MNAIFKIISTLLVKLNSLIAGIDRKTAETIKNLYFILIFVLVIISIFIGYNIGKEGIAIKSPRLHESTNSALDLIIRKEDERPSFNNVLEDDKIRNSETREMEKIRYPAKDELEIERQTTDNKPFDATHNTARSPLRDKDKLFESTSGFDQKGTVAPLEKKYITRDKEILQVDETNKTSKRTVVPGPPKNNRIRRIDSVTKKQSGDVLE